MAADNQNVWFGVSMGLLGVIVGFGVASFSGDMNFTLPFKGAPATPPPASAPAAPAAPAAKEVKPVDLGKDHIRGNQDAKVAIIEYSDFQCPYCKRVHPTIQQIMQTYGDDVMWVYRHFPLSFHPNAQPLAEASECIYEQAGDDGFWKFADAVFGSDIGDSTTGLAEKILPVAKAAGATNEKQFKDCVDTHKYAQLIQDDEATGVAAGVTGTPGNIIYNVESKESRLVPGARPFEGFKPEIDAMLGK